MTGLRSAILAGALLCAFAVAAQTVPPADERESAMPQAQTSEPAPAAQPPAAETPAPASDTSAEPAAATQATPGETPKPDTTRGTFKTMDRIELESSAVTGNRELPKVLYIVPWKKSDMGDLIGRPANSLIDEVLAPVDRDVFKRQIEYYATLNAETAPKAPPAPSNAAPPR